uniref:(California timema) hypothetical protein n=1 Tax=Timema californicum TaxID=61474 RepID=A0A7R9JAP6_TIMCA|nr:unnamed protein product [Timema californicum]
MLVQFFSDSIPARHVLAIMIFFGTWCSYMTRVNLSIAIIGMVEPRVPLIKSDPVCGENETIPERSKEPFKIFGEVKSWDQTEQADLLAFYAYGYFPFLIPGKMLAERFGSKRVVLWSSLLTIIATVALPFVSLVSSGLADSTRFLVGLFASLLIPAMHQLMDRWIPIKDRNKFMWTLLGGTPGTVLTFLAGGLVLEYGLWDMIFFGTAGFTIIWAILWALLVYDSPAKHPRVTSAEISYLTANIKPIRRQIRTGVMSGVPFIFRLFVGYVLGFLAEAVANKNWISVGLHRRLYTIFSHIIPGLLLVPIYFMGCDKWINMALVTVSFGINGASVGSVMANAVDLAPNHADAIYTLISCIGTSSGVFVPKIVGYITGQTQIMQEWRIIFLVNAGMYLVTGILFLIFGSGKVQKWNFKEEYEEEEDEIQEEDTPRRLASRQDW